MARFDSAHSLVGVNMAAPDPLASLPGQVYVSPSQILVTFAPGTFVELIGAYTFDSWGEMTGGTLNRVVEVIDGANVYVLSDFSLSIDAILHAPNDTWIDATVFSGNDTISGSRFDDVLLGYSGSDTITGGEGNDTIDGGAGVDVVTYLGVQSQYTVGYTNGILTVSGIEGVDRLSNVEILSFRDGEILPPPPSRPAITIHSGADIHSAADGTILFQEVASDGALKESMELAHMRLGIAPDATSGTGSAGRDLIYFTPDNKALAHVDGGDGDDIYIVQYLPGQLRDGDPRINETSWGGEDTVWVSENDYILPNYVENLVCMTERGVRMLANDFANKFIGGPGDDQLFSGTNDDIVYGRGGNDLIVGGSGSDTLFGAAGADTFAWERSHIGDNDRIMDWEAADRIDLRGIAQASEYFRLADSADGVQITLVDANAVSHSVVTVAAVHDLDAVRATMRVDADDFVALATGGGSYGSGLVMYSGGVVDTLVSPGSLDIQISPPISFSA